MKRLFNQRFWTFGGWFTMGWIAVGSAVLGAATSLYGANKQSDDNAAALAAIQAAQANQNNLQWSNYLLTRGIAPINGVPAGTLPTADNSRAVNSRLPLWANVNISGAPKKWVKAGTPSPAGRVSLALSAPPSSTPTGPAATGPIPSQYSGGADNGTGSNPYFGAVVPGWATG